MPKEHTYRLWYKRTSRAKITETTITTANIDAAGCLLLELHPGASIRQVYPVDKGKV